MFGTAIASASLLTWIKASEVKFPELGIQWWDDSGDVGNLDPTVRQVESRAGKHGWSFDGSAETLLWGFGMQWGLITMSGAADPWTGTVKKRALCTVNPPSFSYFHGLNCAGSTGTFKVRKGAVISQQSVTIEGVGPIKHEIEIIDDGSITDDAAFSVPAAVTPTQRLFGSQAVTQFGVPGSLVNLTTAKRIRSVKISSSSSPAAIYAPGFGVNVSEVQYGETAPSLEVDLVVKGDESSPEFGYFNQGVNPTVVQLDILIDAGVSPVRSWKLLQTNCHIIGCTVVPKGNETNLNIKLGTLQNVTDSGPAQIIGKTAQATFLVGA